MPLELTDDAVKQSLLNLRVTFVRGFQYRNKDGETPSGSVLLCFAATFLPQVVSIGYLRFKIRPYKPPPLRCFNCNRYGHTGKHCRSSQRCKKCGKNHPPAECKNPLHCVNCGGAHSAAYGGCPRYKLESQIQSAMIAQKMDYWTARQFVQNRLAPPNIGSQAEFPSLPRSSAVSGPPLRKNPRTNTSYPHPQPIVACAQNENIGNDVISLSSKNFFSFIAEVIKNTLEAYSKNKNVDVDSIITKSAGSKLGIQATSSKHPLSTDGALSQPTLLNSRPPPQNWPIKKRTYFFKSCRRHNRPEYQHRS